MEVVGWMADPRKRKPNRTLDCVGLYCPEPIFRARLELDQMEEDAILEVIADDPGAEEDIPRLVNKLGHQILEVRKEGDKLVFLIRKVGR